MDRIKADSNYERLKLKYSEKHKLHMAQVMWPKYYGICGHEHYPCGCWEILKEEYRNLKGFGK